jgi:uncharacterized membrane protein
MINALLFLVPEQAWVLLLVVAGLLMMIGFRRMAWTLVGSIILLALFSPFIDAIIDVLPLWFVAILIIFFGISFFRLILGRRIADNVISYLIYDLIRAPFRFIFWFLRGPVRRP